MNERNKILMSIVSFMLIILAIGTTQAFFNYTRTGNTNTITVGRISFISRQEETINLSNLFPIDPTVTGIMDDTTIPNDAVTSFDATDVTSIGSVTVYTLDDDLGNNTYKAVIVGDGVIYALDNSYRLFFGLQKMTDFDTDNFKVAGTWDSQGTFTPSS